MVDIVYSFIPKIVSALSLVSAFTVLASEKGGHIGGHFGGSLIEVSAKFVSGADTKDGLTTFSRVYKDPVNAC
jgi:hypothetical protein